VPTERGLALFGILERADPALVDPGVTAQFEVLLDEILVGKQQVEGAIDAICQQATRILERLVGSGGTIATTDPAVTTPADSPSLPRPVRPPSPAMRKFVECLAARLKVKPPRGYTKSAEVCRRFLDQHAPQRAEGPGAAHSAIQDPSAAQLAFAEKIARDKGVTVPDDARASARSLSAWIDANKGQAARRPPTRKGRLSKPERQTKAPVPRSTKVGRSANPEGTALKIPFGNKDIAIRLGARYSAAGWIAPPGTDLGPFRDRGWL
jgi:DNA topoisomerase-3